MYSKKLTKQEKEEYEIIIKSDDFDYEYYYKKYGIKKTTDPIMHFLKVGVDKGYNPSPLFDTKFYLNQYPDVKKAGINPYVHYILCGKKEKRIPKGLTNTELKKLNLSESDMIDYLTILNYGEFDEKYYLKQFNSNKKINPIAHYIEKGVKKGYNPSPLFDTKFYLNQYPDVKKAGINPYVHYILCGKKEKRIPKGLTNTELKKLNLSESDMIDYLTILNYGEFDEKYYLKQFNSNKKINPIVHYIEKGVKKGYNPSPLFDTKFYLNQYTDVKKAGINPYVHYILCGKKEKRIPYNPQN